MTENTKELLVRVSATTELLRSNLIAAEREIARFESTTNAVTQRVERNFKQVGQASGQAKAGMQQLSYQLNDVATMFSLGAKPQQIFASQMGQVLQSVQLMTGGTSKLAAFLGGPWGLAISTAAVALSPFIAKLFETTDAADTATNALETLIKKQQQAAADKNRLRDAEDGLNTLLERRAQLEADIAKRGVRNPATGQLQFVYKQQQELAAINAQIIAGRKALDRERVVSVMGEAGAGIWGGSAPSRYKTPRVAGSRSGGGSGGRASRAKDSAFELSPEIQFRAEMSKFTEAQAEALAKVRESDYEDQIDLINRKADYEYEARRDVVDRLRQKEERQLEYLAGVYERAFSGGVNSIWDDFENIGKRVIARVLAEFTLSRINGGGFDLGSSLTGALTSIFGGAFADGGRPPLGKVSLVGERGPELFVPDVAGKIIPNHAMGGGGSPTFYISMPNASAETVAMVKREIANAAPALVAAATGNTVRALNRKSL